MSQLSAIGRKRQKVVSELKNNFFTVFLPTRCLLARHNAQHQRLTFSKLLQDTRSRNWCQELCSIHPLNFATLTCFAFYFYFFFLFRKRSRPHLLAMSQHAGSCNNALSARMFWIGCSYIRFKFTCDCDPEPIPLKLKKKKDNHKLLSIFN